MSNVVEFSYSYRVKFKSKKRKEKVLVFYSRPPKIVALGRSCAMDVKEIHKTSLLNCKDGVLFITPRFVLRPRGSRRRGILSSLFFSTEFHLSACLRLHSLTVLCMVDISLKPHYQLRIVLVCL